MTTTIITFDEKRCHECGTMAWRDTQCGPGKWYWCPTCKEYTINPHGVKNDVS